MKRTGKIFSLLLILLVVGAMSCCPCDEQQAGARLDELEEWATLEYQYQVDLQAFLILQIKKAHERLCALEGLTMEQCGDPDEWGPGDPPPFP